MFTMYVLHQLFNLRTTRTLIVTLGLALSPMVLLPQVASALYVVSGTPSDDMTPDHPTLLLRVSQGKEVQVVRSLVDARDGIKGVRVCQDAVYVLSPVQIIQTVTVVHKQAPAELDTVRINQAGDYASNNRIACLESPDMNSKLLVGFADHHAGSNGTYVVGVSSSRKGPRVSTVDWADYKNMRFLGGSGGPIHDGGVIGKRVGSTLGIFAFDKYEPLFTIPDTILNDIPVGQILFAGISDSFMVIRRVHTLEELQGWDLVKQKMDVAFSVDSHGVWKKIEVPLPCSGFQLFSNWLTSIDGHWSPDYGNGAAPSGLREGESQATERLYRAFAAKDCELSGVLELQDLRSDRRVIINTGREDSEVLLVHQDTVWYRINDEIWRGTISGSSLKDSVLLAKDIRLVQAHWAFLGGVS